MLMYTCLHCRTNEDKILRDVMIVLSNGDALQSMQNVIETSCELDVKMFPVDEQTCHFYVCENCNSARQSSF